MRRALTLFLLVAGIVAVILITRPSHHCFSGPLDPSALRHHHHPAYLCARGSLARLRGWTIVLS